MGRPPSHRSSHHRGLMITALGVLVLSPDSLLVRLIAVDQWTMVFWRGILMALALALFYGIAYGRGALDHFRAIGAAGLAIAGTFAASSILFVIALNHTSVVNTLIIVSAAPLFAAIFSRIFLAEIVSPRTWAAILASLGGIGVIVSGSSQGGTTNGDLAALGTAVCMAGALSLIRRERERNMVPAMALSGLLSALIVLPLAAPLALDPGQTGLFLLLGLIVLPVSFGLITLGPRYLPAPEVGLVLLLETVLGPYWVWLVIGETPSIRALIGGSIVIGVLILHSALALRQARPGPKRGR